MKSLKWSALVVAFAASDTIRPFVITMAPVWAVAIAGAIVLLRPRND